MKRDREAEFGGPEPGWVEAIVAWANYGSKYPNPFHDDSLEWDRCAYSQRLFGGQRNITNRMLPLGLMIKEFMWNRIDEFVNVRNVDIDAPCVWIDSEPHTPLQWAAKLRMLNPDRVEILWSVGLSASSILCQCFSTEDEFSYDAWEVRRRIKRCKQMEDSIMAMVWCCRRAEGTAWLDVAAIAAERMRRVDVRDWVECREGFDN
jgi:hypothetical protein